MQAKKKCSNIYTCICIHIYFSFVVLSYKKQMLIDLFVLFFYFIVFTVVRIFKAQFSLK